MAGVSSLTFCDRHLSRDLVKNGSNGSLFSGMSALCSTFHVLIQPVQLWDCQALDILTGFLRVCVMTYAMSLSLCSRSSFRSQ